MLKSFIFGESVRLIKQIPIVGTEFATNQARKNLKTLQKFKEAVRTGKIISCFNRKKFICYKVYSQNLT